MACLIMIIRLFPIFFDNVFFLYFFTGKLYEKVPNHTHFYGKYYFHFFNPPIILVISLSKVHILSIVNQSVKFAFIQTTTSFYGLLDEKMILAPVPTGDLVEVPYYPGHCYAAYLGNSTTQVLLVLQYIKT